MNDLQDRLDSSFGSGPAHVPLAPVLAAGQRAVRRRRLAAAGGALAVLAVAGGTGIALAGGHPSAGPVPATHQPTVAPSPTKDRERATDTQEDPPPWGKDEYARILPDGTVQIRPGAVVHDRVDDYLAGAPRWDVSVALDISYHGDRQWLTVEHLANERGGSSGYTAPSAGWADFRAWVADQGAANGADATGGDGYPDLVKASAACAFTTVDPARMLAETTTALPPGFARAAYVGQEGNSYLVLCRVIDGRPDVIRIHAEKHGDTLGELLDYAGGKYASGEGVR
jgi:hypothetical protein